MAEFESERGMPADADAVFAVVADLDRLPEWMPPPVGVRPTGEGEVYADVEPRGVHAEGMVRVRPEQLSFLGHQPETHAGPEAAQVQRWIDEALGRLERLVSSG